MAPFLQEIFGSPMAALLTMGGIVVLLGVGGAALLMWVLVFNRGDAARSQVDHRFWTFYRINDRLYRDPKKRRLAWSQERFRHHRFRWQSEP